MNYPIKLIQLKHFKMLLLGSLASISCQVTTPVTAQAQTNRNYAIQPTCPAVPPPGGVICYTFATAPRLRRNSQGAMVENWQIFLQRMGHFQGPATGFYGPATEEAVRRFQRATGLKPDGIVGPATWREFIRANAG